MSLSQDLAHLDTLAYHRREWSEDDLRRYYALSRKAGRNSVARIAPLHRWMLVPLTLWPFNVHDVFRAALDALEAGRPFDPDMDHLLETLPEPPPGEICDAVARHEHLVQAGHYEELVTTSAKFDSIEKAVTRDPQFQGEWKQIKARWKIAGFADAKGILRRSLSAERNLRPDFNLDWSKPLQRFQAVFDAFCLRWNLYGMKGDEPLVTKLSVNLTPHGTMIFIPAYWSFDAKRDVRWDTVTKLHRARVPRRQGSALAEGLAERMRLAEKLQHLDREALHLKLKGEKKHAFLCAGLGWVPETSAKRISRLRAEFTKQDTL